MTGNFCSFDPRKYCPSWWNTLEEGKPKAGNSSVVASVYQENYKISFTLCAVICVRKCLLLICTVNTQNTLNTPTLSFLQILFYIWSQFYVYIHFIFYTLSDKCLFLTTLTITRGSLKKIERYCKYSSWLTSPGFVLR